MDVEEMFMDKIWGIVNESLNEGDELMLSFDTQGKVEEVLKEYHEYKSKEPQPKCDNCGKYVILDFRDLSNIDYMKNEKGEINYYDNIEDAYLICGMYEFEDAWI